MDRVFNCLLVVAVGVLRAVHAGMVRHSPIEDSSPGEDIPELL
jgi:hypothetical protein